MTPILRLELEYGPSQAAIVGSALVESAMPPSADPAPEADSDGVWLSMEGPDGVIFHRVLPQPDRPVELFAEDGTIAASEGATGATSFTLDLPWTGEEGTISVRSGRSAVAAGMDMDVGERAPLLTMSLGAVRAIGPAPAELAMNEGPQVTPLGFGSDHPGAIRLVFLPDGFTMPELEIFHAVVDDFLDSFRNTPPFEPLLQAFGACRVEIASPTGGIRDPLDPDNGAEPVFGSQFGSGSGRRLIKVDQSRALKAAKRAAGSHAHFVGIVVANTTDYGGSGGDVAVFSRHALAAQIAIHELGHSLFNLADEYSTDGRSSTDKPIEANVAAKPHPQQATWALDEGRSLKWGAMLSDGVALPTLDAAADPETVGAYEGAKYRETGIFRPSATCKMRMVTASFCPVCRAQIRARLQQHLP